MEEQRLRLSHSERLARAVVLHPVAWGLTHGAVPVAALPALGITSCLFTLGLSGVTSRALAGVTYEWMLLLPRTGDVCSGVCRQMPAWRQGPAYQAPHTAPGSVGTSLTPRLGIQTAQVSPCALQKPKPSVFCRL